MEIITEMNGVASLSHSGTANNAFLGRRDGRLVVCGGEIDLFQLIKWIEENPLSQYRQITKEQPWPRPQDEDDSKPHWLFRNCFNEKGELLEANPTKSKKVVAEIES
jgi:hypothetical protein